MLGVAHEHDTPRAMLERDEGGELTRLRRLVEDRCLEAERLEPSRVRASRVRVSRVRDYLPP